MSCIAGMDKPITIQQIDPNGTADAAGHVSKKDNSNWIEYERAFASCISKGGREFWKVSETGSEDTHVWRTKWTRTLAQATPAMRLVFEDIVYEITSIDDIDLAHDEIMIKTKTTKRSAL